MRTVQVFGAVSPITQSSTNGLFLLQSKRNITRLYTSYYKGDLFPNQISVPQSRLPAGVKVSSLLNKGSDNIDSKREQSKDERAASKNSSETEGVSWSEAQATDMIRMNEMKKDFVEPAKVQRPYSPLGDVAQIELKGDYLTEGGLHQEALECYGVVAKAFQLSFPENHSKQAGILIKLSGAFRRTGRYESSKRNLEKALSVLDNCDKAPLELIVESLLELGLTLEAMHDAEAGPTYEEAVEILNRFHNSGDSHRMLRLLPRLGRRFNLNHEQKFLYYSPFDYDRTFALGDQCLEKAEQFYQSKGDSEGVIRVLQTRKELVDKKFFNMRDFTGRIHTMRGHWMRRARVLTNAPTPEELLRFSPTIHQVYRDFKYELNAPIGRESEVQQGVNRVVMDMGNPYRCRGQRSREMLRDADYNFAKYVRAKEFSD